MVGTADLIRRGPRHLRRPNTEPSACSVEKSLDRRAPAHTTGPPVHGRTADTPDLSTGVSAIPQTDGAGRPLASVACGGLASIGTDRVYRCRWISKLHASNRTTDNAFDRRVSGTPFPASFRLTDLWGRSAPRPYSRVVEPVQIRRCPRLTHNRQDIARTSIPLPTLSFICTRQFQRRISHN